MLALVRVGAKICACFCAPSAHRRISTSDAPSERASECVCVIVYFCLCQIHISSCPSRELSLKSCVYCMNCSRFSYRDHCVWNTNETERTKKEQSEWKKNKLNIFLLLIIIRHRVLVVDLLESSQPLTGCVRSFGLSHEELEINIAIKHILHPKITTFN